MSSDRRGFLLDTSRMVGALVVVPALLGCNRGEEPVVRVAEDDETPQARAELERADAELLLKAAELEESAVKVYNIAATLPFIRADVTVITTAGRFLSQHQQHRDFLIKGAAELGLRGGDPSRAPLPTIPKEIVDATKADDVRKRAVLLFARSLEMGAAKAYFAYVVRKLRTEHARKIAADILPVETQHVAVYDLLLGGAVPAPTPFFSEQV